MVGATFEARHFIFQTKTCSGIDMHKTEIPTLNSKEKKHRVEVNSFLLPRACQGNTFYRSFLEKKMSLDVISVTVLVRQQIWQSLLLILCVPEAGLP